ncbi:DUF2029 domain-containing protein [bacterium]|nr:MAG: DUF2029 domain-containing protein [bacterium]
MLRGLDRRRLLFAMAMGALVPLAVLMVVSAIRTAILAPYRSDFAVYYGMSTIGLQSGFSHLYDDFLRQRVWDALGIALGGPLHPYPIIQLPTLAVAIAPLALMPFMVAYAIWLSLLGTAILIGWWMGAPGGRWGRGGHLVALLALLPVGLGLYVGQVEFVVFASVLAAWWLLRRGHDVAAGLVLLLIVLKPQEAILLPFALLLAGRRRTFAVWAAGAALIASALLAVIGVSSLAVYLDRLGEVARHPGIWESVPGMSLPSLLGGGLLGSFSQLLVAAFALLAAWRRRGEGIELPMAIAIVGSMVMTPYLHEPDTVMLVAAGWLYLRTQPSPWAMAYLVAGYIAIDLGQAPRVGWTPLLGLEIAWLLSMGLSPRASRPAVSAPARATV